MSWLLLAFFACEAPDFAEEWQLDRLRLLAMRAEPAEPRPGDVVTFTSLAYVPGEAEWSSVWFACMEGDAEGCTLDPALAEQLERADELTQAELAELMTALRDAGFVGVQPGMDLTWFVPDDALEGLTEAESLEGLSATVTVSLATADDNELTLKRVPVSLATTPNQNPEVAPLRFDGNPVDETVSVTVDRNNDVDLHAELANGAEDYDYVTKAGVAEVRTEEPSWRWYTSGGLLAVADTGADLSFDPHGSVESDMVWTTPKEPGDYTLAAVALDGRGGMGWRALVVHVQ